MFINNISKRSHNNYKNELPQNISNETLHPQQTIIKLIKTQTTPLKTQ